MRNDIGQTSSDIPLIPVQLLKTNESFGLSINETSQKNEGHPIGFSKVYICHFYIYFIQCFFLKSASENLKTILYLENLTDLVMFITVMLEISFPKL